MHMLTLSCLPPTSIWSFLAQATRPESHLRHAVELGEKAVALDESNPFAHACLAFPYMYLKEFDKAISEAEKGISLAPNYAGGYFALGAVLANGRSA